MQGCICHDGKVCAGAATCQKPCGIDARNKVEPCSTGCICPPGIEYCQDPKVCPKECGLKERVSKERCPTDCLCPLNTRKCSNPDLCPKVCGVRARKAGRKKGMVTNCEHTDLPVYAMGMCNHCYHKYGRSRTATDCPHAGQRLVYAKGKCQNCYINDYNKLKRREKKLLDKEKASQSKD